MNFYDIIMPEEKEAVKTFLKTFKLQYEDDIDQTIVIKENQKLIATASSANNIIKCVAILPEYQGQNLLSSLMSEMIKRLNQKGIHHYFVYTLDEQAHLFKTLGLKPIVQTMTLSLLEGGATIQEALKTLKETYNISNKPKASVVVNANPMTKGHYHLIETVSKENDEVIVFVVSEEKSIFPFNVRFNIVKKACELLKNVTVVPSLEYLVSYATFPKYFLKQETVIREEHALIDVLIFKEYYMKILHINKRYVGEEPLSPMTNMYNETMSKYLNKNFIIIPRKTLNQQPISASTVRKLLKHNGVESVKPYVIEATYAFLLTNEGHDIIERIKTHENRH
ncbi:[citrate (pro-3S)-lyase] ligase [Liberiplasma polymorphum]|uniref:[citrate (pro-3S)-lyase] ligase n=1 Tax=Liberiplasma polymorphum TaxID=3374570 RepID=UPI003774DA67